MTFLQTRMPRQGDPLSDHYLLPSLNSSSHIHLMAVKESAIDYTLFFLVKRIGFKRLQRHFLTKFNCFFCFPSVSGDVFADIQHSLDMYRQHCFRMEVLV